MGYMGSFFVVLVVVWDGLACCFTASDVFLIGLVFRASYGMDAFFFFCLDERLFGL